MGWDFSEVDDDFTSSNTDLWQLRAMLGSLGDADDDYGGDESGEGGPEEDVMALPRHMT